MPTISLSMIVKNEEACLAACLASAVEADEIVIVDTGSTDRTVEIARQFTPHVYAGPEFEWTDEFARSRNQSLARCTGEWILILDADETLEPGGMDKIRAAIAAAGDYRTIHNWCYSARGKDRHRSARVFRRCPEVFWVGDIHNHLSLSEDYPYEHPADYAITYGYSEAHKQDPDRALRILGKVLIKNPRAVRETYYLAREYWYRRDYATAARWWGDYLTRAKWAPEMADAHLMLARCYQHLKKGDLARQHAAAACMINAQFREAFLFLAAVSGPKNAKRWREVAATATNEGVLFVREEAQKPVPKQAPGAAYYDKIFASNPSFARYQGLYRAVAAHAAGRTVLDVGCGPSAMAEHFAAGQYRGFDFAPGAVAAAQARGLDVWVGSVYDPAAYREGAALYTLIEVIEHLEDDLQVLAAIPAGQPLVITVPSFDDPGHVRTYDEAAFRTRYGTLLDIACIRRFGLREGVWTEGHPGEPFILLCEGRRQD
jgi:tetratricopeptide (TPR) repeat protein